MPGCQMCRLRAMQDSDEAKCLLLEAHELGQGMTVVAEGELSTHHRHMPSSKYIYPQQQCLAMQT